MKIYVAIDDTDSLEVGATGQSANELRKTINDQGWGKTEPVTRHQLLLHPDVPYTSHNSSMCFIAHIEDDNLEKFIDYAAWFLKTTSAEGSDPGLCIALNGKVKDIENLIHFGYKAKKEVITKEEAYLTAQACNIHLSEHGGTGQGIIGALAGVALRITGNDGRFQGKVKLKDIGKMMRVGEILADTEIEEVQSVEGQVLEINDVLEIGEKIKTVLLDNKRKLLVYRKDNKWHTCTNKYLEKY
ncbi:MAG TPA: hypothetical protein VHQ70_06645 [Syntrophomonadaceae bacterium]|nr:hypothetical protein [Syntrophomonadaceae bacterium]